MSVIFLTTKYLGKLHYLGKPFRTCKATSKWLFKRKFSDGPRKFVTFDEVVAQRRDEARRSIVVQVNSESSFNELYGYCSKYSEINGIHHYRNAVDEHFMLIEFKSEENLKDVFHNCCSHQKDIDVMALQSPFVWFRAASGKKEQFTVPKSKRLTTVDGNVKVEDDVLFEELAKCESVSQQIQMLYDRTVLNDLGVRLRYIVARQLEVAFESLYANICVRPFGSSVNGFGKMGCDLDLVLTNIVTDEMSSSSKRLVYQQKKCSSGARPWQRHMELVGEALELRVGGAARPARILHARVPILKYAHEYTALDVDLCYTNMSGVYMSSLLWSLGSLDARCRPLVSAVRRWAQASSLTSPHPGRWITNFPLTLLVLFFLQQTPQGPIIPTVKSLTNLAKKEDVRIAEDNINCTFLRDMNQLPSDTYGQGTTSLERLLLQFFEFYAQFDFQNKAVSINEGVPVRKPNALPLYIVNPLEQALNVSRNVSYEECERFRSEVRNAAWQLDSSLDNNKTEDWGLLSLIEKKSVRGLKKLLRVGNSHRLVSVKDLFKEDEDENVMGSLKSKMQRLTHKGDIGKSEKEVKEAYKSERKEQRMKFKNNTVASEVYRIQREKM